MNIKFDKFIIALAPMAGVTDFAFRKICADFGADMVVSEMISVKALENKNFKTEKMLREESNAIRCCQLFGHETESIEKALATNLFNSFDVIDFNCGCPAPKIVKNKDWSRVEGLRSHYIRSGLLCFWLGCFYASLSNFHRRVDRYLRTHLLCDRY